MFQLESSLEGLNIVNFLLQRGYTGSVTALLLSTSHPAGEKPSILTPRVACSGGIPILPDPVHAGPHTLLPPEKTLFPVPKVRTISPDLDPLRNCPLPGNFGRPFPTGPPVSGNCACISLQPPVVPSFARPNLRACPSNGSRYHFTGRPSRQFTTSSIHP
jgi:hypothetical protein